MKHVTRLFCIVALILRLTVAHAVDQAYLTADKLRSKVGEPIQLRLYIRVPKDAQLILPNFADILSPIMVTSVGSLNVASQVGDGDIEYELSLSVVLWQVGAFVTPPLTVSYLVAGGTPVNMTAESIQFDVISTLAPNDSSLRPFKPQVRAPYILVGIGFAVVILASLVTVFILRFRFLRGLKPKSQVTLRQKLVDEDVIHSLKTLEQLRHSTDSSLLIYANISNCLRGYINQRCGIQAWDLTTFELITNLHEGTTLTNDALQKLSDMLRRADLVKFAHVIPKQSAAQQFAFNAAEWIRNVEAASVDQSA